MARHLVIVSGNDSSLPLVSPPDTTITLVQTEDRGSEFQESVADRYVLLPCITRESLIEALSEIHRDAPITALVCFLEPVILAAAQAAEDLGLYSNPLAPVATARDKIKTREALERHGIPQCRWRPCRTADEVLAFREELDDPSLIVKPITGAGSAGVRLVQSEAEIREHFAQLGALHEWALIDNPDLLMIAEELLPGREVSVEAMTVNGVHEVLQITGKLTSGAPDYVELGHWQPSGLDAAQCAAIEGHVSEVLDAIGHWIGPSHTEVMIDGTDVWLVETHTRFGGDQIWELTELTTGRHMATETVFAILGEAAPEPGERHVGAAIAFLTWTSSDERPARAPGVVRTRFPDRRSPIGAEDLHDSSDLSGYVLTAGPGALSRALTMVDKLQKETL